MSIFNNEGEVLPGTKVRFSGVKPGLGKTQLTDVTCGKVYEIEGFDSYGQSYFIDDVGEKNYAAHEWEADGIFEVVTE